MIMHPVIAMNAVPVMGRPGAVVLLTVPALSMSVLCGCYQSTPPRGAPTCWDPETCADASDAMDAPGDGSGEEGPGPACGDDARDGTEIDCRPAMSVEGWLERSGHICSGDDCDETVACSFLYVIVDAQLRLFFDCPIGGGTSAIVVLTVTAYGDDVLVPVPPYPAGLPVTLRWITRPGFTTQEWLTVRAAADADPYADGQLLLASIDAESIYPPGEGCDFFSPFTLSLAGDACPVPGPDPPENPCDWTTRGALAAAYAGGDYLLFDSSALETDDGAYLLVDSFTQFRAASCPSSSSYWIMIFSV